MHLLRGLTLEPEAPKFLFDAPLDEWQMTTAERCTLLTLLRQIRPEYSIEIGTAQGGSLSVLSRFSGQVYSIDLDPTCRDRLGARFTGVEFLSGRSQDVLPSLLNELQAANAALEFVLIDGDHSREGVQRDIAALLQYRPTRPLYVLLHDSFNPDCRRGILAADWAASPYVHNVEVDFVPGSLHSDPRWYRQLWEGFGLAVLLPERRSGSLSLRQSHELEYQSLLSESIHSPHPWKRLLARVDAAWQKRHRGSDSGITSA